MSKLERPRVGRRLLRVDDRQRESVHGDDRAPQAVVILRDSALISDPHRVLLVEDTKHPERGGPFGFLGRTELRSKPLERELELCGASLRFERGRWVMNHVDCAISNTRWSDKEDVFDCRRSDVRLARLSELRAVLAPLIKKYDPVEHCDARASAAGPTNGSSIS